MNELTEKLLEIKHLKQHFVTPRGTVKAVDDLSFDIYKGETLGWLVNQAAVNRQQAEALSGCTKQPMVRCCSTAKMCTGENRGKSCWNSTAKCR